MNNYKQRIANHKSKLLGAVEPVAAAAALFALAAQAEAVTVYTTEGLTFSYDGTAINPFNGDYQNSDQANWFNYPMIVGTCGGSVYQPGTSFTVANFYGISETSELLTVPTGTILDGTTPFENGDSFSWTSDTTSETRFYAFKYSNQGINSDETYFGWVEMQFNPTSYQAYVTRFALGDNNEAVTVGAAAVPEPTTFACLGGIALMFGSGLIRRRH
jgi:hypothetical protein